MLHRIATTLMAICLICASTAAFGQPREKKSSQKRSSDATVWVNGWLVRRHEGGYDTFREDITSVVNFGGRNVIAVRVDASKFEAAFGRL